MLVLEVPHTVRINVAHQPLQVMSIRRTLPRSFRPCPSAPPSKRRLRFSLVYSCLRETRKNRPFLSRPQSGNMRASHSASVTSTSVLLIAIPS
jgi:hypothetical protein